MGKQAVCFCAIVRNEAHVIRRCIDSVRPLITHWAIVDTGSADGTQEIIRQSLSDLPGLLIERKWTDFATARNQSLDLGRAIVSGEHGAYLLTIDADEVLVFADGFELPELTHDSYALAFRLNETDQVWGRRAFFRAAESWRFEGIIHEHPVSDNPGATAGGIPGLSAWSRSEGARSLAGPIAKAKRDIKVLRRAIRLEPGNPRHWFYLAQSYATAKQIDKAIGAYEKRASMGGFAEEIYHSLFQVACLREFRGDHIDDVRLAYLRAYEARPTRAEPLFALAVLHNDYGMPAVAELYARAACSKPRPPDALIVTESVYAWRCADELAGALARQGKNDQAAQIVRRLLDLPNLPDVERPRFEAYLAEVA
jgi:glycosyltransferase involved in cell wall biosynthesis